MIDRAFQLRPHAKCYVECDLCYWCTNYKRHCIVINSLLRYYYNTLTYVCTYTLLYYIYMYAYNKVYLAVITEQVEGGGFVFEKV